MGSEAGVRELPLLENREDVGIQARAPCPPPGAAGALGSVGAATASTTASSESSFAGTFAGAGQHGPALANQFNYEPPVVRPLPPTLRWIRDRIFKIFLVVVFAGTFVILFITYFAYNDHDDSILFLKCQKEWKNLLKYMSIPLVSIIFTWWHVWLGIQMCFYPVAFRGCCAPYLGWQGIVPRRAHIMASRSCDIMIGTLITVEEIIDRIHPEDFFTSLMPVLSNTSSAVVAKLAAMHCPEVWQMLPDWCKVEIEKKVLEESKSMFAPVIADLKGNINQIVDIKQMAIDVLVDNKPLLVEMFLKIGNREFVFIQHVSAVMGFILGVFQMTLWILLQGDGDCSGEAGKSFHCWGGFVILPLSGLIIGYFTNWLGITMIFRPVEPRIICGGYVNLQGVFLKRQQQVSKELANTICTHLVHARMMMEYVLKRDDVVEKVLGIYQGHISEAVDQVLGRAKVVLPRLVGEGSIEGIKQDVVRETMKELPNHSAEIEAYMDRAFGLRDTIAYRLSRLHPERFEGMLHPVFQEDEWMVLLLGGVLGVLVGTFQAFALGS